MGSLRDEDSVLSPPPSRSTHYGVESSYPHSKPRPRPDSMSDTRCTPTFTNLWVGDTMCGCKVFETVLSKAKQPVERRPTDTERSDIIKSGNVFVYKEKDNGIKRWTDGLHWSPSRISGNFLVYRELPGPFPPGHKKKALKRKSTDEEEADDLAVQRSHDGSDAASLVDGDSSAPQTPLMTRHPSRHEGVVSDKRSAERSLYGSLTKSYEFKHGGLMKKTMSVQIDGQPYHLVAYYDPREVEAGILKDSTENEDLADVRPRADLLYKQSWRAPLDLANAPPMPMGSPQAYQTTTHLGMPGMPFPPHYGYPQPGGPYSQFAFTQGQAYHTMPYGMPMAPPNAYYANVYQHYPQSAADMPAATAAPSYPSFPHGYSYPSTSSNPGSPSQAQEYHGIPSPPSSRDQSTPGYAILPSQNPRRPDGRLYSQHEAEHGFGGDEAQRHGMSFSPDADVPFQRGQGSHDAYKHERSWS